MAYKEVTGNLFGSDASTLVNTVNCVGVMGKGIALEFRRRFPKMFEQYKRDCMDKKLIPGKIYSYPTDDRLILNFAIKGHWKYPSKIEWIQACLRQFSSVYKEKGISSVAFPWMGALNGGIPIEIIKSNMREYLEPLEHIDIEVYNFDPSGYDPLFEELKKIAKSENPSMHQEQSGIQKSAFSLINEAVINKEVLGLSQISTIDKIGNTTVDKLYKFLTDQISASGYDDNRNLSKETQLDLF